MKTEVIKKLIEYICSRLESFNQDEVFVGQLVMINDLFDHLNMERLSVLLSDKAYQEDIAQQLANIGNHMNAIYSNSKNKSDENIEKIKNEYNAIRKRVKTMVEERTKQEVLLNEIKATAEQENKNIETVSMEIVKVMENHSKACTELSNEYHKKIAVLRESADVLLTMKKDNKEIIAHLEENRHVFENLKKNGVIKEGDALKKTTELETRVHDMLKEYDSILVNFLELAKKEKEEISKRQKFVKEAAG